MQLLIRNILLGGDLGRGCLFVMAWTSFSSALSHCSHLTALARSALVAGPLRFSPRPLPRRVPPLITAVAPPAPVGVFARSRVSPLAAGRGCFRPLAGAPLATPMAHIFDQYFWRFAHGPGCVPPSMLWKHEGRGSALYVCNADCVLNKTWLRYAGALS